MKIVSMILFHIQTLYCYNAISTNFLCEIKLVNQAKAKIKLASTNIVTTTTMQMTRKSETNEIPELSNLSTPDMKRV